MIAKIIVIGWTLFIGWAFLAGIGNVLETSPNDAALGFAVMFSAMFHLFLWMLVTLPTYMISRMFRRDRRLSAAP